MGGSNATDKRTVRTAVPGSAGGRGSDGGQRDGGLTATHALATGRAHCTRNPSRGGGLGRPGSGRVIFPGSENFGIRSDRGDAAPVVPSRYTALPRPFEVDLSASRPPPARLDPPRAPRSENKNSAPQAQNLGQIAS